MHGWLNYQIEHHLWPDLSMRQYQKVQPRVKALCEKYDIPSVQEIVVARFVKLWKILLGVESMRIGDTTGSGEPAGAASLLADAADNTVGPQPTLGSR